MKRLPRYVSLWALAGVGVWIVVMVIAYNWAIPIYANVGGPGLCGETAGCSNVETVTVNVPGTLAFAIVAASIVTACLAATVLLVGRSSAGGDNSMSE